MLADFSLLSRGTQGDEAPPTTMVQFDLRRGDEQTSQDAKVDLKLLIISVIPIYGLSDTINLFCVLVFILINKLITFSAS